MSGQSSSDPTAVLTLTADEAAVLGQEMVLTRDLFGEQARSLAQCDALIRRLRLEADAREAAGWWGDACPYRLRSRGAAPESFEVPVAGLPAFAELMPELRQAVVNCLRDAEAGKNMDSEGDAARCREELRLLDGVAERLAECGAGTWSVTVRFDSSMTADVRANLALGIVYAAGYLRDEAECVERAWRDRLRGRPNANAIGWGAGAKQHLADISTCVAMMDDLGWEDIDRGSVTASRDALALLVDRGLVQAEPDIANAIDRGGSYVSDDEAFRLAVARRDMYIAMREQLAAAEVTA